MPSEMFYHLSDEDLGRIIAWIRSTPPAASELPRSVFGPMLRGMILYYRSKGFQPLAAQAIDHGAPRVDPGDDPVSRGRYLAITVCTECHGAKLEGGNIGLVAPPLTVAKAYDRDAFDRLMVEGIGLGDRELGIMTQVSLGRFSHFTPREREDLFAFLQAR